MERGEMMGGKGRMKRGQNNGREGKGGMVEMKGKEGGRRDGERKVEIIVVFG